MSVLKVPLLVDLQQKVGEIVISITSCPSIIIFKIFEISVGYRKMWLWQL
jgi:hypothetical protein